MTDFEAEARSLLTEGTYGYFAGGAGDERVLAENVSTWARHRLAPSVLVDVAEIDTSVTLLGRTHAHPFLLAPVAYQRHAHRMGELATARAAVATDTTLVLSSQTTTPPSVVAATMGDAPRWMQLYVMRDPRVTDALVQAAVEGGFEALVMTVDFPVGGLRERDHASGFAVSESTFIDQVAGGGTPLPPAQRHAQHDPSVTWDHLPELAERSGLPLILKGVLRPDDARRAVDAGASAIIVSNHGGRQLDAVLPTSEALGPVVEAVGGRIPVLVDGGIRRGWDAAVALALGADAVLVGRPYVWGLVAQGEIGVAAVVDGLVAELRNTLALVGCPAARDLDASFLA